MKSNKVFNREKRRSGVNFIARKSAVRAAAVAVLLSLLIITYTGCGDKEPVSDTRFCLDTACEIKIYDMEKGNAEKIIDDAFAQIIEYENMLSKTVEGSDVYRINNAKGNAVAVSEDTAELISEGTDMGKLSEGAFDITIGRLTDLWDFKSENPELPSEEDINEALATVDYRQIETEADKNGRYTVKLKNPEAKLDLGGIAKGRIADKTGEFLEKNGVEHAIINLGGNIVVIGEKEEGTPWNIGIERPYSDRTEIIGSLEAVDATIVTSGIYERMFEKDGRLYHHIIDSDTGYPAETDLEAVTIMAAKGNSGFCDGLSTICLMIGKERALELVEELQRENPTMKLEAAFTDKNDDTTKTDGMKISFAED